MRDPTPDLPDDTEIDNVHLPMIIGVVLKRAGIWTVGEIRQLPDENLRRYPRLGRGRVALSYGRR